MSVFLHLSLVFVSFYYNFMYRKNERKRERFVPYFCFSVVVFGFLGSFSDHDHGHGCSMAVERVVTVTYSLQITMCFLAKQKPVLVLNLKTLFGID